MAPYSGSDDHSIVEKHLHIEVIKEGFSWLNWIAEQPIGIIAWVMGSNDLSEMRAGRMDREGEGQTNGGRICGMIAVIVRRILMSGPETARPARSSR